MLWADSGGILKATKAGNGGERAALAEGQADGGEFGEHVAIDKKGFIYLAALRQCGVSVPWPGIKPVPPALEAETLNQWTTREVSTTGLWMERSD